MTETITSEPAGKRGRNGSVILTDRICEKRARGTRMNENTNGLLRHTFLRAPTCRCIRKPI